MFSFNLQNPQSRQWIRRAGHAHHTGVTCICRNNNFRKPPLYVFNILGPRVLAIRLSFGSDSDLASFACNTLP
jgi:hypothetical protein